MKSIFTGIPLIFIALALDSPVLALFLGVGFALILKQSENPISQSLGTRLLQVGIIFLGLTISSSGLLNITTTYFPLISIYVFFAFFIGLILAKLFKLNTKVAVLISSGTAICGATAIAAVAPLIKAKPKQLLVALIIVFVFNATAIIIFPYLGNHLDMSEENFGAWVSMAVHDTASVIGTSLIYGPEATDTATTLKLARTLWLIPLIFAVSIFYKKQSNLKLPIFIILFICAAMLGSFLEIENSGIALIDTISNKFIGAALFCIGSQINKVAIKEINLKVFAYSIILWLMAAMFSYYIISF